MILPALANTGLQLACGVISVLPLAAAFLAASLDCRAQSNSNVRFEIAIQSLPDDLKPTEPLVREAIQVAAEMWTKSVVAKPCSIEIELTFKPWPNRGAGRSLTAVPLGGEKINGRTLLEEGLPHELRTGNDPNGTSPDVEIILDPEYTKTLWWDPKPSTRRRPMPGDKLDAISVLAHEFGHAMGFNGRLDPKTGQPTGGEISTYDRWVEFDGKDFFFTGPAATKLFRKKVPLSKTLNNYHHFGEPGNGLDRKLQYALMNGIYMEAGRRFVVTDIDLAVLADCGVSVRH